MDNDELFLSILQSNITSLSQMTSQPDDPRYAPARYSTEQFESLIEKYGALSTTGKDPLAVSQEITEDLYVGVPRWNSPWLQYNVGTAVNPAAGAAYSLALHQNIYNINDGLAGTTLVAEESVTKILATLAKLDDTPHGIFTFGGTGTNLYAMRIGIKKALPDSSKSGISKNVKVFVTEDAHFSHVTCAEWLGIGSDNVITLKADSNGYTDLANLKQLLTETVENGDLIGGILVNGGTTYDHRVDDIEGIVTIRDSLVKDYNLSYIPHVHVDTVIGWIWLFFEDYEWLANPLKISSEALEKIKAQYDRIKHIRLADSWGVDFHKSIGGCPIDCSMIVINKLADAMLLSRKSSGMSIHQLASEYSMKSPVDYTLETSRASGAPLAALTALQTSGKHGYQKQLANLIEQTLFMKKALAKNDAIQICNEDSLGFVTTFRVLPETLRSITFSAERSDASQKALSTTNTISDYTKEFFDWDYKNRTRKGLPGPEFSYSSKYTTFSNGAHVGVIKLYPVSPLFNRDYAEETVNVITSGIKSFEAQR